MKNKSKKILSLMLSALLLTLFGVVACAPPQVELYSVTMFGGDDAHGTVYNQISQDFASAHAVSFVDGSAKASDIWQTNVRNSFNHELTTPDVLYYFDSTQAVTLLDQFVPIDDIVAYDADYGKDIVIEITDKYCLPMKGFTEGIIYNTTYHAPQDFVSYSALKSTIIANNGQYAEKDVAAGNDVPHYWFNYLMVLSLGVDEFDAFDGTSAFFTAERKAKWISAIEWTVSEMTDMEICINKLEAETAQSARFFEGYKGILVDGSWTAGKVTDSDAANELEIVGFPPATAGGEVFNFNGTVTSGWYITKKAWADERVRRAAVDYVKAHTTKDAIDKYCQAGGGTPATGLAVTNATKAVNDFSKLASGAVSLRPLDDRMSEEAKRKLYNVSTGIPALLTRATDVTAESILNACIGEL